MYGQVLDTMDTVVHEMPAVRTSIESLLQRSDRAMRQPTIIRENTSIMNATYTKPAQVAT